MDGYRTVKATGDVVDAEGDFCGSVKVIEMDFIIVEAGCELRERAGAEVFRIVFVDQENALTSTVRGVGLLLSVL